MEFLSRYCEGSNNALDLAFIEQFHAQLMDNETFQQTISSKGITQDLIREHRIGIHSHAKTFRYTIPVFNEQRECVQVLSYLPNAKKNKFFVLDVENRNKKLSCELYLPEQLKYRQVILCGGPLKAIIAAQELNKHGIGAISFTTGESIVPEAFRYLFKDHIVYICYDIDAAGEQGALKSLQSLVRHAVGLYKIRLPLDIKTYPKGDLTNWIVDEKQLFFPLIKDAIPYEHIIPQDILPQDVKDISFYELLSGTHDANLLYRADIKSLGFSESGVNFLSEVRVVCTRETAYCQSCVVYDKPPEQVYAIDHNHPKQLALISNQDRKHDAAFKEMLNIPQKCRECQFKRVRNVLAYEYNVTGVHQTNPNEQAKMCKAFFIDKTPPKNDLFLNVTARHVLADGIPEPVLMVTNFDKSKLSMAEELSRLEYDQLYITQPRAWNLEELNKWYQNRYGYLSLQHRIFGRAKMNFLIDLTFHSALNFRFNEMSLNGWLTLLILGDTGTGKSTMLKKLFEIYKLGTYKYQATGSRAGWVGGIDKTPGGKHFFKPGVFPSNDGGLLCIEELKNLDEDILKTFLTSMSEGFLNTTFIQDTQTIARVRLIFTSNTRTSKTLYSTPRIQLLADLLGSEEALRRFDMGYALLKDDKYLETLKLGQGLSDELLANLVRFSWTIDQSKIIFEEDALQTIFDAAKLFSGRYSHSTLLLVDSSSQHNKFARMSVAFACLTFSVNDKQQVVVRKCHVDFIAIKLQEIYDGEELGYRTFAASESVYANLEFTDIEKSVLTSLIDSTQWKSLAEMLSKSHGLFDTNYFYAHFSDRQVATGLFALCRELGFIQALPNNRQFTVTKRWKLYANSFNGSGIISRKDGSISATEDGDDPFKNSGGL
jgi:hypothetical protein